MKDRYISFPLSNKCLAITTTTELGNLAYQVDEGRGVKERRQLLADLLNVDYKRFVFVHQHHSDKIQKVTLNDLGKGTDSFESGVDVDALYTYEKNVPLCIFHADCVPIFFIDETKDLVGIIHAGFKGTLKHIAYKSMMTLMEKEGITPNDIYVYIGPARGVQSFIVNEDNVKEIIESKCIDSLKNVNGEEHFDAIKSNTLDLQKAGISLTHILSSNIDTTENENCFSAYKKTPLGRMMSVIKLK